MFKPPFLEDPIRDLSQANTSFPPPDFANLTIFTSRHQDCAQIVILYANLLHKRVHCHLADLTAH